MFGSRMRFSGFDAGEAREICSGDLGGSRRDSHTKRMFRNEGRDLDDARSETLQAISEVTVRNCLNTEFLKCSQKSSAKPIESQLTIGQNLPARLEITERVKEHFFDLTARRGFFEQFRLHLSCL